MMMMIEKSTFPFVERFCFVQRLNIYIYHKTKFDHFNIFLSFQVKSDVCDDAYMHQ
jgi:hypothetical protein